MNENEDKQLIVLDYTDKSLKAIVSCEGHLVFRADTSDALNLNKEKYILIAEEPQQGDLYLSIYSIKCNEAFPIKRSVGLYCISIKNFLKDKNIDYKSKRIIFELQKTPEYDEQLKGEVYKIEIKELDKKYFTLESLGLNTEDVVIE